MRRRDLTLGTLAAGLIGTPAAPRRTEAGMDGELLARGWRELTFRDKRPNDYVAAGPDGVRVESRGTVSVLHRPVRADLAATPVLAWRWRVEAAPPPTDLTRKGGDDRALAVYVGFVFDPARAGLLERAKRATLEALTGQALPGRVLTYVWGGDGRAGGDWFDNPYLPGAGRMQVLRGPQAPLGEWLDERVDLVADHRAAFGYPPTRPVEVSISADTDDTGSEAVGEVAGLVFREHGALGFSTPSG